MDISSASSLSQITPQSGTKVAKEQEYVAEAQQDSPSRFTNAEAVKHLEDMAQERQSRSQKIEESRQVQQAQMQALIKQLDEFMSEFNTNLSFRVDEKSGKNVVTVYEVSSGDIIRQIPEKEMLELYQQLSLQPTGIFDTKV